MEITTQALVCAVRPHGEHGAIARLLTPEAGLIAGYVRGGRSRAIRPVLIPGNKVNAHFRARHSDQLASLSVELIESRAPLLADPLASAAVDWTTALCAAVLPEEQPAHGLYSALDAVMMALEAAPSARRWAGAILLFEGLMMHAMGFGGDVPDRHEDWPSLFAGLNANLGRLRRHLLSDRQRELLAVRERLVDRLKRAVA